MPTLSRPVRPSVPDPTPVGQALQAHESMARLAQLMQASQRRMALIAPALPAGLAASVKPGPLDDQAWSLLAANAAVAAKLRQLLPRFEALLQQAGLTPCAIKIKILK